jgi:hypothetical protein
MRLAVFSLVALALVACSSTTTPSNADPCGSDPYAELPTCTSALEGVECGREACECCPDHWTCESGAWVVSGYNAPVALDCDAGAD